MTRPTRKIDKDMGKEVEKLGGYRPQSHRLRPSSQMQPRGLTRVEIVSITIIGKPTRRRNAFYRRGL